MATIGVISPAELRNRRSLFDALEVLFGVRFEAREHGELRGLDAAVMFGGADGDVSPSIPLLRYTEPHVKPSDAATTSVWLGATERLDARLRGRRFPEGGLASFPTRLENGEPVAEDDRGWLWVFDPATNADSVVVSPHELGLGEPLRDRLRPGCFLALLPLVHLLRRVTGYDAWRRPPPRAAIIFDDPNLHLPSYGHIRFRELGEHARTHGYHAVMATIPLDCWYAHPRAVPWFRNHQPLSLTMHGNDHRYRELGARMNPADAVPIVEQAMRRVSALERRTGLAVSRVMVPPHEACSDEMMEAMIPAGVEAVCRAPVWWSEWLPDRVRTARWTMADVSPCGLPVIGRHGLRDPRSREEAALNVYLDQPAIFYGHHADVADGYEVLADVASWSSTFDDVSWRSLDAISSSNKVSRMDGTTLHVRLYSRASVVDVEPGTQVLELVFPEYEQYESDHLVCAGREHELSRGAGVLQASVPVEEGARRVGLRLVRECNATRARLRTAPRAVARRGATEARDRMHPLLRRLGLDGPLRRLQGVPSGRIAARMRVRADATRARDRG